MNELANRDVIEAEPVNEDLGRRETFVKAIRDMATFFEKHPEVELPGNDVRIYLFPKIEHVAMYARAFGKAKKQYLGDSFFTINKDFGASVIIQAAWGREKVCERVVVGTEEVEEEVVVSKTTELRTVTKEKVEWRCPKVLAPKEVGDGA